MNLIIIVNLIKNHQKFAVVGENLQINKKKIGKIVLSYSITNIIWSRCELIDMQARVTCMSGRKKMKILFLLASLVNKIFTIIL